MRNSDVRACIVCGGAFYRGVHASRVQFAKRKACSLSCAARLTATARNAQRSSLQHMGHCLHCSGAFEQPSGITRVYCSRACMVMSGGSRNKFPPEDGQPRPLLLDAAIAAIYAGERYEDDPAAVRANRVGRLPQRPPFLCASASSIVSAESLGGGSTGVRVRAGRSGRS